VRYPRVQTQTFSRRQAALCGACLPPPLIDDSNSRIRGALPTQARAAARGEKTATGTVRSQSTAITRANQEGSPCIEERTRGHVYDDAERTTRDVLMDPDVERARGEAARSADRERDRWF